MSIVLVLLGHLSLGGGTHRWMEPLAAISPLGVTMFFVLSGFLITRLLMRECVVAGRISLRRFYARRALRIIPASYFYVGVIALLAGLRVLALRPGDISCALLYVMDFHHDRAWYLGHYWSLSVEEQFYLVWPPIVTFLSLRVAVVIALAILALADLVPTVGFALVPSWNHELQPPNGTAPIAVGCLLALYFDRLSAKRFWRSAGWPIALVFVEAVELHLLNANRRIHGLQLVTQLLVAVVILRSVNISDDFLGKVLGSRVAVTLGALSYSLYIWQQLFLVEADRHRWTAFPGSLLVVLAAGTASHILIERPFLRLKARLASGPEAAQRAPAYS